MNKKYYQAPPDDAVEPFDNQTMRLLAEESNREAEASAKMLGHCILIVMMGALCFMAGLCYHLYRANRATAAMAIPDTGIDVRQPAMTGGK